MCATSDDRSSVVSLARASTDALMRECEKMEAALGRWLAERSAWIAARARAKQKANAGCPISTAFFWRGLILLWASSPAARAKYSAEARDGLAMAVASMDDRRLLSLVQGLLDEAQRQPVDPAA